MFDFHRLQVWQRSHELSLSIDRALERRSVVGPSGLAYQLSRACAAVPANIAEGAGQSTSAQCARFLDIAIGSASETENHLARAAGTGMLNSERSAVFLDEIGQLRRMLLGFKQWVLRKNR